MSVTQRKWPPGEQIDDRDESLARIATALEKIARLLDEGIGAALNAKYKFGRPTDRWARR